MKVKALRKIDQRFYNYWQALYLAFFSPSLYVDVGKRWKGLGVSYLLFVIAIAFLPFGAWKTYEIRNDLYERYITPLENVPPIFIKRGQVFFNEPMPYQARNKRGEVIFIVDTTGVINSMDVGTNELHPNLFMLITKDKIFFRVPAKPNWGPMNKQPQDAVYEQTIDKNVNEVIVVKSWLESSGIFKVMYFLFAFIYPGIVFAFFGLYLALFLAFAMMGQLISKLYFNMPLNYKQAMRLLSVSSTPYFFFVILTLSMSLFFPGSKIILLVILLLYFCFAIHSLRNESKKLVV